MLCFVGMVELVTRHFFLVKEKIRKTEKKLKVILKASKLNNMSSRSREPVGSDEKLFFSVPPVFETEKKIKNIRPEDAKDKKSEDPTKSFIFRAP